MSTEPTSFGHYRLERKIGSGGMGDVWLARHDEHQDPVVVKRLHAHLMEDEQSVARFFDELKHTRPLRHPNIVRVFDGGRIAGNYFLAMEWIDGLHLRDCLEANGGPLSPPLAASLARQAATGLAFAHAALDEGGEPLGLVHRDISPDNLMLATSGTLKVLDFGIARSRASLARTNAGIRHGKLLYIAPEYLEDGVASPCSDVYSLGMTLWELCTGQVPFAGDDPLQIIERIFEQGVPSADSVRPDVPGELARLISAATRVAADERIPSMEELALRLSGFLQRARPPAPEAVGRQVCRWKEGTGAVESNPSSGWKPGRDASEDPTDPHLAISPPGTTEPVTEPMRPAATRK